MASYSVLIKPGAGRELEGVSQKKDRERIIARIGCEKLSGQFGLYRVRVGSYRVVYAIDDSATEVHVVKVGHRRDVYR
ncbi:MAG: type II toxin-antitoxin system RelE/ParE family toxin [Acidobacteria bacterium]|nr:type II toxin-antitoxin system RelE/ParE family toxin [Acidobacteriota bacterium]MCI0622202.1 type II toxin-antitoxin system RelE/ParE family toxin [Acidobacteriota bacterium]MCI0718290.1 type II toxin-antitoxin system RelE/ParE family toxin [Acidobacteriota bacterium]